MTHATAGVAAGRAPGGAPVGAGTAALLLAAVLVVADWRSAAALNVAVLYSVPLVLAAVARRRRLLWLLAASLACMGLAVWLWQARAAPDAWRQALLFDRLLAAAALALCAGVLDAWLRSLAVREQQERATAQHVAQLAAAHADLLAQCEELRRRGEALEARRQEAEAASHRKTRMLASISHDVRSPLQSITLMAAAIQRVAERPGQADRIPALVQRLQAQAVSAVDFLTEVIDLAAFDTGRLEVQASEFELQDLLAELRERLLPAAESKGLALVVHHCDMRLRTDRVKLGRILGNLLGNAIKFTATGSVEVRCALGSDDGVCVRVSDTGCGIQPENLGRIFTEFAQVGPGAPAASTGWGLGLAIAQRMARLLGGDIQVDSRVGHGSHFTVTLPPECLVPLGGSMKCFLGRG